MQIFTLKSSKRILVKNGRINEAVLVKMIDEAYKIPDLYAENRIFYKRKDLSTKSLKITKRETIEDTDEIVERFYISFKLYKPVRKCEASYKELWDCYRNLTGKDDKHPYDKKFSDKEKGKVLALQKVLDIAGDVLEYHTYFLSNLSPPRYVIKRSIRALRAFAGPSLKPKGFKRKKRRGRPKKIKSSLEQAF